MTDRSLTSNLRFNGLNRAADDGEPFSQRVVELHFNRTPTDDELRALHVYMRYFSGDPSSPDPRCAECQTPRLCGVERECLHHRYVQPSTPETPKPSKKLTRQVIDGMRIRHAAVENASDKLAVSRDMAYLSHLDRAELLGEVERLRAALEHLSLYVAVNGDDWVQKTAREYLNGKPAPTLSSMRPPTDETTATHLRREVDRLRLLLRPFCKHPDLYDGHFCMDCGLSPASPVETSLPLGFVMIAQCASCGVYDKEGARHSSRCAAAPGELVRPSKKESGPKTPVYPDDWKKPNKVGCNNFQLRGGEYCGNCGFHASEHSNI